MRHILISALLSVPLVVSGSQDKDVEYEFRQEDTRYAFRGSFLVHAESDWLINLIYDFNNLSEYTVGAQSVELIQQGENWYDVVYTYRKLFVFEHTSTWRRTFKPDEHKIMFDMLSSTNNLKMMPELISSTGYYQIIADQDHCRVEYFQECLLKSGFFNRAYVNEAQHEALKFLHEFKTYLERKCESSELNMMVMGTRDD